VEENEAQLLNYLRATDIEVGLPLNFGREPEIKRKALDNRRKRSIKNLDNPCLTAGRCVNLRPKNNTK